MCGRMCETVSCTSCAVHTYKVVFACMSFKCVYLLSFGPPDNVCSVKLIGLISAWVGTENPNFRLT